MSNNEEKVKAILAEILFKPEARVLRERMNNNLKLDVKSETWTVANRFNNLFTVPIRNSKCNQDRCSYDLEEIIRELALINNPSRDGYYKCPNCKVERAVKDLVIDIVMSGIISRIKNVRYDQLKNSGMTYDNSEFQEELSYSNEIQALLEKGGEIVASNDKNDIDMSGSLAHRSFFMYSMPKVDISRLFPDSKSQLQVAKTEIDKLTTAAAENLELFQQIFGEDNPFKSEISMAEMKDGLGIFEISDQIFDTKKLRGNDLVFFLMNEALYVHYPGLGLSFGEIKLVRGTQTFTIPQGARLSKYVDDDRITRILITGGIDDQGNELATVYEIEITPQNNDGKLRTNQGIVLQKESLKKGRHSHAILWHPQNNQIFLIGGAMPRSEPTSSVESGEKSKGKWEWFPLKELQRPRLCGSVCVAGDYIYVFGGYVKKNREDNSRIGFGNTLPILDIERMDLRTNKSEILTKLSDNIYLPPSSICFPNSFQNPSEIIFLGEKGMKMFSYVIGTKEIRPKKAEAQDMPAPDGNYGWGLHLEEILTIVPAAQKILKYNLTNDYISYSKVSF